MSKYITTKIKACQSIGSRLMALFAVLVCLAACPSPGPECVYADDWGQLEKKLVAIDPTEEFTSAGIDVLGGEPLYMEVRGGVDICPTGEVRRPCIPDSTASNGCTHPYPIDFDKDGWQPSGISVNKGDSFKIFLSGSYNDSSGNQTGGSGLYAMIAPPPTGSINSARVYDSPGPENAQSGSSNSLKYWPQGTPGSGGVTEARHFNNQPHFFELYDNQSFGANAGGYTTNSSPYSGELWFRYARTSDSRELVSGGNGKKSPWRGTYHWDDAACPSCFASMLACKKSVFACIGFAVCSGLGYGPEGDNCKEGFPILGDHWINEGSSVKNSDNTGPGYTITVSTGCPGVNGKFLQALFAKEDHIDQTLVNRCVYQGTQIACKCAPPGVPQSTHGCVLDTNNDGVALQQPQYTIGCAAGSTTNCPLAMSLDPADGYTNPITGGAGSISAGGVYGEKPVMQDPPKATVPASGQLWFRLIDDVAKPSDMLDEPRGCAVPSGCLIKNPTYVTNPQCTDTSTCNDPDGYPWGVNYSDNVGEYTVEVITTKVDNAFSAVLNGIVKPVRQLLFGVCRPDDSLSEDECDASPDDGWRLGLSERLYLQLVATNGGTGNLLLNAIRTSLVLYIMIYGFCFAFGMIKDVQTDFVARVFKVAIIVQLLSPNSWNFFYNYLFIFFVEGMDELIGILAGEFMAVVSPQIIDPITGFAVLDPDGLPVSTAGLSDPFAFVNHTIQTFFSQETMIKIAGLLFASPVGWLFIILIFWGMYFYVFAILKAVILYLLAMLAIALLLTVAPIFISFLLFERTKSLFNSWVMNLLNYALQPVLVLTALSMFNIFVHATLYTLLHFSVCWQCVLEVTIPVPLFPSIKLCLFKWYAPWGGAHEGLSSIPIGFFLILIYLIVTDAMSKMCDWMATLAAEITTSIASTSLADTASATLGSAISIALGAAGTALSVATKSAQKAKGAYSAKRKGGPQQGGEQKSENKEGDSEGGDQKDE